MVTDARYSSYDSKPSCVRLRYLLPVTRVQAQENWGEKMNPNSTCVLGPLRHRGRLACTRSLERRIRVSSLLPVTRSERLRPSVAEMGHASRRRATLSLFETVQRTCRHSCTYSSSVSVRATYPMLGGVVMLACLYVRTFCPPRRACTEEPFWKKKSPQALGACIGPRQDTAICPRVTLPD